MFAALLLVAGYATPASAQAGIQCAVAAGTPVPTLRAEGLTEEVGDVVLDCTGGVPTPPGTIIFQTDLTINLPGPVTSRPLGSATEALLLIDDPGPSQQVVCPTPATGCPVAGAGGIVSFAAAGLTNVFQGVMAGQNAVTFHGIPVEPPAPGGPQRVYRITNIRTNASGYVFNASGLAPVPAYISWSDTAVPIANPAPTVGYNAKSLNYSAASTASSLQQCQSYSLAQVGSVTYQEEFATAFKIRVASGGQNQPGIVYNTESGLVVPTPFGTAGLADFGTRFTATLINIPSGVAVYVDSAANSSAGGSAVLVGSGGTTAQTLVYDGTTNSGTGSVTIAWEVTAANPGALESFTFGIYISYTGGGAVAGGTADITGSYGPISFGTPTTIPAFVLPSSPQTNLFTISPCVASNDTISGQVTLLGSGLSGVNIALSGSQSSSTTTNSSGNYSFTVAAGGNYTVNASSAGYTISPPGYAFTNISANQTASFVASAVMYTISGHVSGPGGALSGVTITFSGTSTGHAVTDSSGNYTISLAALGNYTVTPSLTGYTFSPPSLTFNNLSGNQTASFSASATATNYTISGQVTLSGSGLSGVVLTLSGSQAGSTTTSASGNYSFTVAKSGSYTVTPSLTGFTFNPPSQTFSNVNGNLTANFIASVLPQGPATNAGGVVNAASYAAGGVAPGSIASAYGSYLLTSSAAAGGVPLPVSLASFKMQFNGEFAAPLYYVSGGQVNLQVPWELQGQSQTTLTAALNGQTGPSQTVPLTPVSPGIFSINAQGTGQGAILDSSYKLVDASNPATPGSTAILIYCTGLGPVSNQPASGAASPGDPLAETPTFPTVTIGGAPAQVLFSGLAPGFVGEYQVNAIVPAGSATGAAVPVTISMGGITSNTVTIAAGSPTANGTLQVQVTGLPAGTAASVSITSSNGFSQTITASQSLQVPPGTYTFTVNPAAAGSATYYAQTPPSAIVTSGSTTTVQVTYGTSIPNTTKTLDPTGLVGISVSADHSTVTLPASSTTAQSLAPGDVLAVGITPSTPNGLLRKVVSVSQSGSQIVATTAQATLADAFPQLDFKSNTVLDAQTLKPAGALPRGVTLRRAWRNVVVPRQAGSSVTCTSDTAVLVEMLNATILEDSNGSITTSGELDICPSLEFDLNYSVFPPSLNSLTATATITGDLHVNVQGEYQASFDKQVTLITLESDPIPVDVFGVPLVLTPSIAIFVGASGEANGSFSMGATQTASFTGGMSYLNSQVSPVEIWSKSFSQDPTSLDATLSGKIYAGTTFALSIDDILSPQLSPDAYLQLDVSPLADPWWTLSGGMELSGSVDVSIIGLGHNFDFPNFFQLSFPIAQAQGGILPSDQVPVLQSIDPASAAAGSSDLPLAASGSNFVPGSAIVLGQTSLTTQFVSPSQLTATIPAALLGTAGSYPVTVANPAPEAGVSQPVVFTIQSNTVPNPVPSISSLSPSSTPAGSAPLTLTIAGAGFMASSSVTFNGAPHTANVVNSGQITIGLSSGDLATADNYAVVVSNPSPGGGASNAATFVVQPASAAPVLTGFGCPTPIVAGSSVTATVTISSAAPAGGVNIAIQDAPAILQFSSPVTVPGGQTNGTFSIGAPAGAPATSVTLTATLSGVTLTLPVAIGPAPATNPFENNSFDIFGTLSIEGQQVTGVEIQTTAVSVGIPVATVTSYTSAIGFGFLFDVSQSISGSSVTYTGADPTSFYVDSSGLYTDIPGATLTLTVQSATVGAAVSGTLQFNAGGTILTGTFIGTVNSVGEL